MSWQAVQAVLNTSKTRTGERMVLVCIAERFNATFDGRNVCRPSAADIARLANLNTQRIGRIIDGLAESGELIRLIRPGSSSYYIVTLGMSADEVAAYAVAAWSMTLKQVEAANKSASERLSRSQGNGSTLRQNIEGLRIGSDEANPSTNDRRDKSGQPYDKTYTHPSTKRIPTLRQNVDDPSTNDRTEPYEPLMNHKEPYVAADAADSVSRTSKPLKKSPQKEKEPPAPRERDPFFDRLAELTQTDPALQGSMIGKTTAQLKKAGADLAQLERFAEYWRCMDWRGQKGQPPTLGNVSAEWGRAKHWDGKTQSNSQKAGTNSTAPAIPQLTPEQIKARRASWANEKESR